MQIMFKWMWNTKITNIIQKRVKMTYQDTSSARKVAGHLMIEHRVKLKLRISRGTIKSIDRLNPRLKLEMQLCLSPSFLKFLKNYK